MRYLFLILGAAFLLAACNATDSKSTVTPQAKNENVLEDSANFTSLQWLDSTSQDLGKLKKGQVAKIAWHFKNTGSKPLVIQNVAPGCGCTVAERPEEPVLPGKEAVIKAKFDSQGQHEGEHTKNVTVYANTSNSTMHQLQFKVQVTP